MVTAADFSKLFCELEGKASDPYYFERLSQTPSNSSQMSSDFISCLMDKPTSQLSIYTAGIKSVRMLQQQRIMYDILTLRHAAGGEFLGLTEEMVDEFRQLRDGNTVASGVREVSSEKPPVESSFVPSIIPPPLPSFQSLFDPSVASFNAPKPMHEPVSSPAAVVSLGLFFCIEVCFCANIFILV